MLQTTGEVATDNVKPYWDPQLRYNRETYHSFVKKLQNVGYFQFTLRPLGHVGIFFVWKCGRTKLRMITDARGPNRLFADPPGVSLVTGEGLGRIEVELPPEAFDDPDYGFRTSSLALGILDVQDCFHRDRVPHQLARYFCWEPVPAKVLGLDGQVLDGRLLGPLDADYPCAGSLCQGCSWSLYFAQRANKNTDRQVKDLGNVGMLQDRGEPPVFNPISSPSKMYSYIYVDNIGVLCCCVGNVPLRNCSDDLSW